MNLIWQSEICTIGKNLIQTKDKDNDDEEEEEEEKEKEKEKEKENNKNVTKSDNNLNKNKNKSNYKILDINYEEIQLSDLLEIFQGPVPIDGLIAIATTNHFEEIKNMCPALFRPGRLTPIHFDYADGDTIQEISQYYYNKNVQIEIPEKTNIPTSLLIEMVIESRLHIPNDFEHFSSQLEKELTKSFSL